MHFQLCFFILHLPSLRSGEGVVSVKISNGFHNGAMRIQKFQIGHSTFGLPKFGNGDLLPLSRLHSFPILKPSRLTCSGYCGVPMFSRRFKYARMIGLLPSWLLGPSPTSSGSIQLVRGSRDWVVTPGTIASVWSHAPCTRWLKESSNRPCPILNKAVRGRRIVAILLESSRGSSVVHTA